MADEDVVNIKNGPELSLTYVIGHDLGGKGGRQSIANLMNFGVVGGVPGPVIAQGKIVYGNNEGGQYSPVAYNEAPSAFALVMRDFSGDFTVNDPTSASNPANMQWTQAQIAAFTATMGQIGGPAGPLDGGGKIPNGQIPPLTHDTAEAATEAEMLALVVTAPAMCVRTDFSPPHLFFLTADPASTLSNWHDMGAFAAASADPTGAVGPTATNGVASTYMRSDAAPAQNLTATYVWTGAHSHSVALTLTYDMGPAPANAAASKAYADLAATTVQSSLTTHAALIGAGAHLPTGGTVGQIPIKGSGSTVAWGDAPSGGGGVPTTTQSNRVYVTSSTGTQSQISYSNTEAEPDAMVQYAAGGELFAGAPTDPSHAATKGYVDNAVSSGVTVAPYDVSGESTTFGIDGTTPEIISIDCTQAGKEVTIDDANTPIGKKFVFVRVDNVVANTVTLNMEVGSTVNGQNSTDLNTQYAVKQFYKMAANTWVFK